MAAGIPYPCIGQSRVIYRFSRGIRRAYYVKLFFKLVRADYHWAMRKTVIPGCVLIALSAAVFSQQDAPANAAPAWFLQEIATLTSGSGRWIASNAEYQGENEPYDAYGTEWVAEFGGSSMRGHLFGMVDGEEVGEFWQFRQYWHPGRKEAVVEQFGWGTVGIGTAWKESEMTKSDQFFFTVDGGSNRSGHVSHFPDKDTHVTASFDIIDDEWVPRRKYTWTRQAVVE
tara:strand:+ start:4181 stop:4864 length:684 start_codon:yes stop_codon:yes gene_type:complete